MTPMGITWACMRYCWYRLYLPYSSKKQQKVHFILEAQFKFEKIFLFNFLSREALKSLLSRNFLSLFCSNSYWNGLLSTKWFSERNHKGIFMSLKLERILTITLIVPQYVPSYQRSSAQDHMGLVEVCCLTPTNSANL